MWWYGRGNSGGSWPPSFPRSCNIAVLFFGATLQFCSAVEWYDSTADSLFSGATVQLFSGAIVQLFSVVQQWSCTAVQQLSGTAVQLHKRLVVKQYSCTAVQQCNCTLLYVPLEVVQTLHVFSCQLHDSALHKGAQNEDLKSQALLWGWGCNVYNPWL